MMLPSITISTITSSFLLYSLVSALNLECERIQVDKKKFDLSKLGGPHSILVQDTQRHPSLSNTTWTLDICQNLRKPKDTPETPKEDQCPNYTRGNTKTVYMEKPETDFGNSLRHSEIMESRRRPRS